MSDRNTYKYKLRSSNRGSADKKSDIVSPKSEISKKSKKTNKNTHTFSRNGNKAHCIGCQELINEGELQAHQESCQIKKCPNCQELFPSRLIGSHINVCNTSSFSLPNVNRQPNLRTDQRPQATPLPLIRKRTYGTHDFRANESPNQNPPGLAGQRNSNRGHHNLSNASSMFPNINTQTNANENARSNNTNQNNNNNSSNMRDPFSSMFEDFSSFNSPSSPPHFYNRFSHDSNGNQFFFSNDFQSSEGNRNSSNSFQPNQQEREGNNNNPFTRVFFQRGNNNGSGEGPNVFFNSNGGANNNSQNTFGNINSSNPFSEFDRIFGPSGVFARITAEMRRNFPNAPNVQRSFAFRTMPFDREESEANHRFFDSFSLFIDSPIFVTFRNSRENRTRGLNPDEINNIPTSTFNLSKPPSQDKKDQNSSMKSCVVCLDDFKNGDLLKTLKCGHKFHQTCIDHWLPIKGSCPVCRVNLSSTESN